MEARRKLEEEEQLKREEEERKRREREEADRQLQVGKQTNRQIDREFLASGKEDRQAGRQTDSEGRHANRQRVSQTLSKLLT